MALFLIERKKVEFDETIGFVIRARNENRARVLASEKGIPAGSCWVDPSQTTCTKIEGAGYDKVIIESFKYG